MQVRFANRTLERAAIDLKRAKRSWRTSGVAEAYMERIPVLYAIDRWEQLQQFPSLGFHALYGARRGQYAITLTKSWRLILEYDEIRDEITVLEVTDYHD